jgi:hypothetical protein
MAPLSPVGSMGSGANSVIGSRWVMDDAFAQQAEAGAAIHLSFDRFEPVDVAFGSAGTVGQGKPRTGQYVSPGGCGDLRSPEN